MPLDLGAKGSCQIGGNVSTNAGQPAACASEPMDIKCCLKLALQHCCVCLVHSTCACLHTTHFNDAISPERNIWVSKCHLHYFEVLAKQNCGCGKQALSCVATTKPISPELAYSRLHDEKIPSESEGVRHQQTCSLPGTCWSGMRRLALYMLSCRVQAIARPHVYMTKKPPCHVSCTWHVYS